MRPTRVTGPPAVPDAVDRLLRKFEYPRDAVFPSPPIVGGGGGELTVTVALDGATAFSLSKCDFQVSDGFGDFTPQLADIFASISGVGGRVRVSEGNLNLISDLTIPSNCSLEGLVGTEGPASNITGGATITLAGSSALRNFEILDDHHITCTGAGQTIADIVLNGADVTGSLIETGSGTRVENVTAFGTVATVAFIDVVDADCTIRRIRAVGHQNDSPVLRVAGSYCVVDGLQVNGGRMLEVDGAIALTLNNLVGLGLDSDNAPPIWVHGATGVTFGLVVLDGPGPGVSPRVAILIEDSAAVTIGRDFIVKDYSALGASESTVFRLDGATDSGIAPTIFNGAAAGAYDLMQVVTSDRNLLHGGVYVPDAADPPRYGISLVSGNNNVAYANMLGDASLYTTADFNDAATGTITTPDANGQFTY